MTPGTISLGLVPSASPSTSYVPPLRNDWDLLFQLMFDELLNPPPSVVNQVPEANAPIVEKYGFESCEPVDSPMVEKSKMDEDKEGKAVDPSHYRGMIGTLLYLTASRHDLQFAICMCARYQARPIEKHLHA
nr:uncharacterized mitochondrial protein AtMg00810-like [Tanacetum cinerariifolium]